MDMTGEYRIPAPRDAVWAALNDPEVLKQVIPGCEELNKLSDTELTAKVAAKVGPVSARFTGKVTLSDINPPESYTISGEGQGGVAGFAKGGATVNLEDAGGNATILKYTAKAQVGGKLAQIGSRLIDSTARKMADEFFAKFADVVASKYAATQPAPAAQPAQPGTATPPPAPEAAPAAVASPTAGSAASSARKGLSPAVWGGALVAVVVVALALLARR
jgi:carbon monoxide dehydrogenase subunit G